MTIGPVSAPLRNPDAVLRSRPAVLALALWQPWHRAASNGLIRFSKKSEWSVDSEADGAWAVRRTAERTSSRAESRTVTGAPFPHSGVSAGYTELVRTRNSVSLPREARSALRLAELIRIPETEQGREQNCEAEEQETQRRRRRVLPFTGRESEQVRRHHHGAHHRRPSI
jgi:hypothetical protein